jgi:hypothetical protein
MKLNKSASVNEIKQFDLWFYGDIKMVVIPAFKHAGMGYTGIGMNPFDLS